VSAKKAHCDKTQLNHPISTSCDIAIIGGGPVGVSLALALRGSGLSVTVLEAQAPQNATADARALALSYGSRLVLERLGVWGAIQQVSAIRTIHISQRHAFGRTVLRAEELAVPAMGYVVPYHALHTALQQTLHDSDVNWLTGASVTELKTETHDAQIVYQHDGRQQTLHAKLAVVADGGKLLEAAHPPEVTDYGQSAVIAHLTASRPLPDTAFERFTAQGPVALLPYRDGYELVWTAPHEVAQQMLGWEDDAFLAQLHVHFGDRVGKFLSVGKRTCFPLRLKRMTQITLPHAVLIGNAAQTLHPVAGQGFNLGLRDAWELGQMIVRHAEQLGEPEMLRAYERSRRLDRAGGIRFTDGLVRLFSNDMPLLREQRAAALSVLDCLPFTRRFVARRMMFGANG
jgi:2-octaprenyl-6-methoxyphenol hydroxylase